MNKPISIVKEEFTKSLVELVNNGGLPLIMVEPILADCYSQVKAMNAKQLENDRAAWEDHIAKEALAAIAKTAEPADE